MVKLPAADRARPPAPCRTVREEIYKAALAWFERHGVRRTLMEDAASEAGAVELGRSPIVRFRSTESTRCFAGRDTGVACLKHDTHTVVLTGRRGFAVRPPPSHCEATGVTAETEVQIGMAKRFSDDPAGWADLADLDPDRGHAEWRNEILSFLLYAAEPEPLQSVLTRLRPAV